MNCRFTFPILLSLLLSLGSCAAPSANADIPARVATLLPADALLLGEQHDAPDHQRIHREVIDALVARAGLAAVVLEMADQGGSTAGLPRDADEAAVQAALKWNNRIWPWGPYRPAVMAAVRAGAPVLGGNLQRSRLPEVMADVSLDGLIPGPALKTQQQAIRVGHCNALPESQIGPMTRVQIARDLALARSLVQAAVPGKTVVLLAGGRHVDRQLGVPLHLPHGFNVKTVLLRAESSPDATEQIATFEAVWPTPAIPVKDYCAEFRQRMAPRHSP